MNKPTTKPQLPADGIVPPHASVPGGEAGMIGGEHFLCVPPPVEDSMAAMLARRVGRAALFASGRDALYSLLAALPCATVALPDLICRSVFDACRTAGKQVTFYKTGADLAGTVLPQAAGSGGCVVVMHYFGRANNPPLQAARACGATVLSDVTHMLFAPESLEAIAAASQYVFASLRKSGPFPDGGFIASRRQPTPQATGAARDDFVAYRAAGLLSRGFSALQDFPDDENLRWTRQAEAMLDASPPADHRASFLSRQILRTVAMDEAIARTRSNMEVLSGLLHGALHCFSSADAPSPYFFCSFSTKMRRDEVRAELARHRFYFPVHWDTSWQEAEHPYSGTGLSIPCDGRYGERQMKAAAGVILSCLSQ
jgi:hypothetical protein